MICSILSIFNEFEISDSDRSGFPFWVNCIYIASPARHKNLAMARCEQISSQLILIIKYYHKPEDSQGEKGKRNAIPMITLKGYSGYSPGIETWKNG